MAVQAGNVSFSTDAIRLLSCPYCASSLHIGAVINETPEGVQDGLMACENCGFEYPIVAGIVIIGGPNDRLDSREEVSADLVLRGPRVADLVEMIKDKKAGTALNHLLNPSALRGDLFPDFAAFDRDDRPGRGAAISRQMDRTLGR